jgi:hypothetical protein
VDPGRLTDGVSIGLLATVFPDDRVVAAIEEAGVKERRNRALPARLMVYFALVLWQAEHITQLAAARYFGVWSTAISRIEKGIFRDHDFTNRHRNRLDEQNQIAS